MFFEISRGEGVFTKKILSSLWMRVFSWWLLPDLNWGHKALQASALPTELKSHTSIYSTEEAQKSQE